MDIDYHSGTTTMDADYDDGDRSHEEERLGLVASSGYLVCSLLVCIYFSNMLLLLGLTITATTNDDHDDGR